MSQQPASPESADDDLVVVGVLCCLAERHPHTAAAIVSSARLRSAIAALVAVTDDDPQRIALTIGQAANLSEARRPVDVLISRAMAALSRVRSEGTTGAPADECVRVHIKTQRGDIWPIAGLSTATGGLPVHRLIGRYRAPDPHRDACRGGTGGRVDLGSLVRRRQSRRGTVEPTQSGSH